jgi:hypothetical protein
MQGSDLEQAREEMQEFFRSFMLYEYPVLDPNSRYHVMFRQLLETLLLIGDRLKKEFPDQLVALGLRGSYSHGHPYEGNDVDVLFMGEGLTPEIEDVMVRIADEELAARQFELCHGKVEMGMDVKPIRFFDLDNVEHILKSYMYGLAGMLYEELHVRAGGDALRGDRRGEDRRPLAPRREEEDPAPERDPDSVSSLGVRAGERESRLSSHLPVSSHPYPADSPIRS